MSTDQYTSRAATRAISEKLVLELGALGKNSNGHYEQDQAQTLIKGVKRQLATIINIRDPGNGMKKLLDESENPTNQVRSNDLLTGANVLASAKKIADDLATANPNQSPATPPTITTTQEANEEADRLNTISQHIIGAKEGTTAALKTIVGTAVLDAVLRTADGADIKGVDEYELHEVLTAILDGADRPTIQAVHEKYNDVLNFDFDFRKKIINNVETLRSMAAKMTNYGHTFTDATIVLVLLTNVTNAAAHNYGSEFRIAITGIRKMFKDSYVHDALSLKAIMAELSVVDGIRDMKKAPAPSNLLGSANAVDSTDDLQSRLREMIDGMGGTSNNSVGSAASVGSSEYESAYGTATSPYSSSDSESSGETRKRLERRLRKKKDEKRKKDKTKRKKDFRDRRPPGGGVRKPTQDGDCPHCVLHGRTSKHPWCTFDECYFNKKWKGWRPEWACEKMGKKFKKKKYFSVEMGGSLCESSESDSN
jgi:hypothetical protein